MENGHQVKGGGAVNVSSECCVGLDDGEKIAKIGKPLWSWRATRSWIIMRIVHAYIMNRGLNRLVVHKYRTWLVCVFFNLIEFADRRRWWLRRIWVRIKRASDYKLKNKRTSWSFEHTRSFAFSAWLISRPPSAGLVQRFKGPWNSILSLANRRMRGKTADDCTSFRKETRLLCRGSNPIHYRLIPATQHNLFPFLLAGFVLLIRVRTTCARVFLLSFLQRCIFAMCDCTTDRNVGIILRNRTQKSN